MEQLFTMEHMCNGEGLKKKRYFKRHLLRRGYSTELQARLL